MTNESSPLEQWNVTGRAERNVYTGNYGPILPNNQGTVNINAAPAPKVDRPPSNIPFLGTDSFVGRDSDLVRLDEQLQQENRIVITAVTGMGGVGKTELAVQYARQRWQEAFPGGVCWLSARGAEGDADIGTQIITFGKSYLGLNPPEELDVVGQAAFCWRNWPKFDEKAQEPESVLVVLDDVTDYRQVEPYLPRDDRFTVLMTTRVELGSRIAKLPIGVLARADALELLRQLAGAERIDAELETADALCEWLGDLPLGLELVGRYLAMDLDLSLEELWHKLEDQELQARALTRVEQGMTANLGVASAFELSWRKLSEEAQELACLLSCFALAPIPWKRVEACFSETKPETLQILRNEELLRLSLLKRVERGQYQYHQLIQRFIRAKLPENSPLIGAFCRVMVAAAQEIDDTPTKTQTLAWGVMTSHVAEVATQWCSQVADEDLIWPFVGIGRFYQGQGFYTQAKLWFEQCLVVSCERLDRSHISIFTSLTNLARLYSLQGLYEESELLFSKAVALYEQSSSRDHFAITACFSNLALLYRIQGRYNKAESAYLRALEICEQTSDIDILHETNIWGSLAEVYREQGRYGEAEPIYLETLELQKHLLGSEHPEIANSLNNLGLLYHLQGLKDEAKSYYLEALKLYQRLLGKNHPNTATGLNNLAELYHSQGDYHKAEPLYLEALEIRIRLLGTQHTDVAASLNNLAGLYRTQGRYSEAESNHEKALQIYKQLFGKNHPDTANVVHDLAFLYYIQESYGVATAFCVEALKIRRSVLSKKHPDTVNTINLLGMLYSAQEYYGEAEQAYMLALSIVVERFGENHPDTQAGLNNLAYCLQQALAAGQADSLSDHPLTQQLLAQLQSQPPES